MIFISQHLFYCNVNFLAEFSFLNTTFVFILFDRVLFFYFLVSLFYHWGSGRIVLASLAPSQTRSGLTRYLPVQMRSSGVLSVQAPPPPGGVPHETVEPQAPLRLRIEQCTFGDFPLSTSLQGAL